MHSSLRYSEIKTRNLPYWSLLAGLFLFVVIGFTAAHQMDVEGHHISGMNNQIVWGLPHVFAIFLIVAASGALNLASLSSVFSKEKYKPLARFSAVLSIALLIGGLAILLLDLGRPDRLIVAITYYNFKSIFAWNIILYIGFIVIVITYLWLMMERRMHRLVVPAAMIALIWRLILTSGTGLIFGLLIAREAYDPVLLAPLFIVMSFAFGLAVLILLLITSFKLDSRVLDNSHLWKLGRLLGLFIASVFSFVLLYHLSKLYGPQNYDFERFLLLDGGIFTLLFWGVQIGLGNLVPLYLLYSTKFARSRPALITACSLVIIGAFAQLYVLVIGGQAFPLNIFPGYEVSSSFYDGVINAYNPSVHEILLGLGGTAFSLLVAMACLRILPIMPEILVADSDY